MHAKNENLLTQTVEEEYHLSLGPTKRQESRFIREW